MIIRDIEPSDYENLRKIHEKHWAKEFDFPDFLSHYIVSFLIEDSQGIITAGGARTIVECVTLTDKDRTVRDRRDALMHVLGVSKYFAEQENYHQIHAAVQDPMWVHHLVKMGFQPTKGKMLYLDI